MSLQFLFSASFIMELLMSVLNSGKKVFWLSVLGVALSSCSERKYEQVIRTRGQYDIGKGARVIIRTEENGFLNVIHERTSGNIASFNEGIINPAKDWVVYVETPTLFFLYSEGVVTRFYESDTESGNRREDDPELVSRLRQLCNE